MTTETLLCLGPPEHVWEREKVRGRKPRYCPEHKPEASEDSYDKTAKLMGDEWPAKEGDERVTDVTDAESAPKENPFIKKAQNRAKMQKALEGKAQKKEERQKQEREHLRNEYETIGKRVEIHDEVYGETYKKAVAEQELSKMDKAWNLADIAMNKLISVLDRQRYLKNLFENADDEVIAEETETSSTTASDADQENDFEIQTAI